MFFTVIIVLSCLCLIHHYKNENQYQKDLALRFDEVLEKTYPFLSNLAQAVYIHSQVLENNAKSANDYYPKYQFEEAFCALNRQFYQTKKGKQVEYWLNLYSIFFSSNAYGILESGGGKLREEESKACRILLLAYDYLASPQEKDFATIIMNCKDIQNVIPDALNILSSYNTGRYDITEWRWVDGIKYRPMMERYRKEKKKFF